ncbi:MAG: hypothetical protein JRH11_22610, partial [Deltaproteobacteria bacterium]|nr:hypothetical protein [Deltaproteobacteria bacterium]
MLFTVVTLLLPAGGAAQLPIEMRGRPIREVVVAGETAGITAPRVVGIPLGVPVSRLVLRSALERLAESGRWRDAQFDVVAIPGGVRVVAHLVPVVILTRVEVRGNREIGDAEIRRTVGLTEGSELIRETLDELIEAASDAYGELGYENVRIDPIVRDTDDPSRKVLRLEIEEGEPTRISRVQFE